MIFLVIFVVAAVVEDLVVDAAVVRLVVLQVYTGLGFGRGLRPRWILAAIHGFIGYRARGAKVVLCL